jgi:hypothetical protein
LLHWCNSKRRYVPWNIFPLLIWRWFRSRIEPHTPDARDWVKMLHWCNLKRRLILLKVLLLLVLKVIYSYKVRCKWKNKISKTVLGIGEWRVGF